MKAVLNAMEIILLSMEEEMIDRDISVKIAVKYLMKEQIQLFQVQKYILINGLCI